MVDRFIIILCLTCVIAIAATVFSLQRGASFRTILKWAAALSLLLVLITGMNIGTFYSHGFDIPWWAFGAGNGIATILCVLIANFTVTLPARLRRRNT